MYGPDMGGHCGMPGSATTGLFWAHPGQAILRCDDVRAHGLQDFGVAWCGMRNLKLQGSGRAAPAVRPRQQPANRSSSGNHSRSVAVAAHAPGRGSVGPARKTWSQKFPTLRR